jgi:hypothetical protein
MENKLTELSEVRDQIAALTATQKKLESEVFPLLELDDVQSFDTARGTFSRRITKSWTYDADTNAKIEAANVAIEALSDDIKTAQVMAQNAGTATCEEKVGYQYKANKI